MSAPPLELPPSHSTSGHHDGLGRRTLRFDREDGVILERLQLRPELGAFEAPLRERMERAAAFEDERFARVRAIDRDPGGALTVVSEFVGGNRVCDLLEAAAGLSAEDATSLSVDAALGFLLEMLPALAALHSVAGFSHGAVGPDRTVLTPTGQVVLLDSIFGHTLERLQFNRRRLWNELRIAAPAAAGPTRFDIAADLGQASLTGVMIVVGRLLKDSEYPDGLPALVNEVAEIAQIRGSARFASGLHQFLQRTLPLPGRKPYASADEAALELRQLAREIGIERCRTALVAFVADMNRTLAAAQLPSASSAAAYEFASSLEAVDEPIAASEFDEDAIAASAEVEEPLLASAKDEDSISFELLGAFVPEAPAEPIAAPEEDAPALDYEPEPVAEPVVAYEPEPEPVAEPFVAYEPEPVVEPYVAIWPEPEPFEEPIAAAEPEPSAPMLAIEPVPEELVAAEAEESEPAASPDDHARVLVGRDAVRELAVGREIELVRERFAMQAERVPEPRIAYDDSFPDPTLQNPSAPLLELQQETAAWRATFVSLDEEKAAHVAPEPVAEPEPPAPSVRKRKRGSKADRDKLRSNAPSLPVPIIVPSPVVPIAAPAFTSRPAVQMPTPLYVPPVIPTYGRSQESTYGRSEALSVHAPPPPTMAAAAPAGIPLRVRSELPSGYTPTQTRGDRHETRSGMTALPYVQRGAPESTSTFPRKLAAVAVLLIVVGIGVGVTYWPTPKGPSTPADVVSTKPAPVEAPVPAGKGGSIAIVTQPPGARVLLDGKQVGESPMTLEGVAPGRHTLTFVTGPGSVKKAVRVEAGKTLSLDVAVGSGFLAVFAPITLDIAENGKAIGTAEQGRLMLSPGRHELTLSNREFGYSEVRTVEVEPGEERSINVMPMGDVSLNAVPWAEVWIDGKNTGKTTPIKLEVPLGTHEIVFKHPQLGERRQTTVVTASAPVTLSADFTKPSP